MVWLNILAYQECVSLQGTVTQDEYFFMAYKIKSVLSVYALEVFIILLTLTNFFNPSSNPLQRACCGIQKPPPVTAKLAPEPGCESKNCSVNPP